MIIRRPQATRSRSGNNARGILVSSSAATFRKRRCQISFRAATVAVMPYSSSTGCSGVAHLACAYGVPIICADLADFRQMAQGEELAIEFYPPGNAQGLADCVIHLLQNSGKQQAMATQNFSAGLRMTMPNVVQKYLRHFELQQRVQTLQICGAYPAAAALASLQNTPAALHDAEFAGLGPPFRSSACVVDGPR